jgi:hypothetical protein
MSSYQKLLLASRDPFLAMEVEAAAASAPPAPPRRGRPPEVRCEACDSCRNRQWKKACENKDLLPQRVRIGRRGGQAPAPVSASSSAASADPPVQEEGPEEASSSSSSVALAPAPAASSRPEALRVEAMGDDTELRKHLAGLMKIPLAQIGRIRMTPDKQPALVDVASIICKLSKKAAAVYCERIVNGFEGMTTNCCHAIFPEHPRPTRIAKDLKTIIQVIFLLPGREAALVRQAAAELFVRFMGGDLSLIGEVQRIREVQAFLREHEPDHPMRVFGEAVESSAASTAVAPASRDSLPRVLPEPQIVRHEKSIALPGSGHLYAAARVGEEPIIKVGVTKGLLDRLSDLQRKFDGEYDLLRVWPGEAPLEDLVLDKLRPFKASVGASREHFNSRVTLDFLTQVVDSARELYRIKMELESQSFEQRKRELEFQEDLKDRALKRRREELALEAERARAEVSVEAERAKLEAERAKLEAERAREQLLQKLASENNPEAIKVFLERLPR